MSQPLRAPQGGRVDRNRPIQFTFDGREYTGYAGDTLASALLANGVRVTGRSFKYHRPRGVMAAGFEEANTLVQLNSGARTEPNLKATQIELYDGLQARAVNCWPSARFDLLGVLQYFKPLLPAGFYYKTFMAPSWHLYEPAIRRGAGLGHSPELADPDIYEKRYADADVLVVGAGPSGLAATVAAARKGGSVLLVDDKPELGGSLWYESDTAEACVAEVRAFANVRVLTRTTAFGYYDHNHVLANEILPHGAAGPQQRLWKIRAKRVVIATGAIERPLVFPDNDRPGVMLAGAARQYLHRFGVLPARRVVVATNNDSAYGVAFDLHRAGVQIALIADARPIAASPVTATARELGITVASLTAPTGAVGAHGVEAVELHSLDAAGRAQLGTAQRIEAGALLVSGGWNPTVHLFTQSGGSVRFDEAQQAFVPQTAVQACEVVGAANGVADRDGAKFWSIDVSALGRTPAQCWIDFASDATESDLRLAARENFASVEHFKRYTTTGMMTDQGKTSNVNAIGVLASVLGKEPGDVGTTRFRPPFNPVTFGAIAGRNVGKLFRPLRRLAAHDAHVALGAKMEDYGAWRRPAFYPQAGETEAATIKREVLAVRGGAGILEYSPLGKIIVQGPDAAEFLHRMYVNNVKTLKVGRCRYGLMLGEDGVVKDDGVFTRWAEQSYLVGTTSGQAENITTTLEEWLQCEWTALDVTIEQVTTQWAVVMLAGPQAREILERLDTGIDLSADAFPHMSAREGRIGEVPVRIARVSFTGELSYEISVPWSYGAALWSGLHEKGAIPFGLESLMAMRIEKGFLHVGTDTDGMTQPQDVGFAAIIEKKAEDFVGRRSCLTPEGRRGNRRQLVGIEPVDGRTQLPAGAHVVASNFSAPPARTEGWVTSSVDSPALGRPIALALVERGLSRKGETVTVVDGEQRIPARIVIGAAYDPEGARLRG